MPGSDMTYCHACGFEHGVFYPQCAAYGTASVDGDLLPEGERAAFAGLTWDGGPAPVPPGTEVTAAAVQERMHAAGWSGAAGHELGKLARRGLARRVQPGVWVALAAWKVPDARPTRQKMTHKEDQHG